MIKKNELRIGNLIERNGKQLKIDGILTDKSKKFTIIRASHDGYDSDYVLEIDEELAPIPLTPEILKQCGFEKSDHLNGWAIDKFIFYIDEEMNLCLYDDNPSEERIVRSNIQLHTLQNLFFALTGEELNRELNAPVSDTTKA